MPLSKKRNRDRMRLDRATYLQPNPVQPKQAKIRELRDMMKGISLDYPPDDIGNDWDDISDDIDRLLDIDADGNMIPDF